MLDSKLVVVGPDVIGVLGSDVGGDDVGNGNVGVPEGRHGGHDVAQGCE